MKPKEWLVKNGHLKSIGRGRLSAAHIDLIKQAVAAGEVIEGYSQSPKSETVERVSHDTARVFDMPEESRPEAEWEAFTVNGPVGMREVCNNCNSSFTYCYCPHPKTFLDHVTQGVVTFKPRQNPLPSRRW